MLENPLTQSSSEDPRRLRDLLDRAHDLASRHALHSVVVGLAGTEGDPGFPEVVDFVQSALRMDDSIFRMTRERVILLLTDVDARGAAEIIERVLADFREHLCLATPPSVSLGYFEVDPSEEVPTAKLVLPAIFAPPQLPH